jgi:ABC-2 type transport system permease protein
VRSIQGGPLIQVPIFLTLFLAPVYVPFHLLTGWIHAVASVNPATAFLSSGRDLLAGDGSEVAITFVIALGLIGAFGLWSWRSLRSAEAAGG